MPTVGPWSAPERRPPPGPHELPCAISVYSYRKPRLRIRHSNRVIHTTSFSFIILWYSKSSTLARTVHQLCGATAARLGLAASLNFEAERSYTPSTLHLKLPASCVLRP